MKLITILFTLICIISTSCKKVKNPPELSEKTVSLLGVDSISLKSYLKGNWTVYYKRQMFDTAVTALINTKISFNNNVDSIKWTENNLIRVNSKIIFTIDTSPVITVQTTNRINFYNSTQNFSWVANDFFIPDKRLTLIDNSTRTMYFLYKF